MNRAHFVFALACGLAVLAASSYPANGSNARATRSSAFPSAFRPAWSPDGRHIAYVTTVDGDAEIAVADVNGRNQRIVTRNDGPDTDVAWTPDGRLVFVRAVDDGLEDIDGDIYLMRADGSDVVQLTADELEDGQPDVSPDGSKVAFSSCDYGEDDERRCQLVVMGLDGRTRTAIVPDGQNFSPVWSRDGGRIAFRAGEDSGFIDTVRPDGSDRTRLTTEGREFHPSWVLDGRIVFHSEGEGFKIVNGDGSDLRVIPGSTRHDRQPAVSPDGRRLAFTRDPDGYPQVFVSRLDGTDAHRLNGPPRAYTSIGSRCTIVGTPRPDRLVGTSADDVVCGLGGDDRVLGMRGADLVDGGPGRDTVDGGAGGDLVLGAGGDDRLVGGRGSDRLDGGPGDDVLAARDGLREAVDGGEGHDRAFVDPGDWVSFVERIN